MAETNSISQKIIKLLALAEGNKNEHERATAMRLAMELLSKHNLDIDALTVDTAIPDVHTVPINLRPEPWVRSVLHAVCKLYYTRFFIRTSYPPPNYAKQQRPIFVGTEENVSVSMEMTAFLVNSIRLESNALFVDPFERRSFRLGAAEAIFERACEIVAEEKSDKISSSKNSLMVLRNKLEKANDDYFNTLNMRTFKSRSSYCDDEAYGQGESFGKSVNLGRDGKPKAITMR